MIHPFVFVRVCPCQSVFFLPPYRIGCVPRNGVPEGFFGGSNLM